MTLESSFDDKERVRQAIDIVELVGAYLPLRREGRGYKALCPWHDDSRPSLQVNPERQSFRCFVCDVGGDVFSFFMRMEGVTFREALAMLAERAGVPLGSSRAAGPADAKRLLYQAAAWAEEQFHQCLLRADEAEPARQYLASRGITRESVAEFRLGFSPQRWDWIIERAHETPYTPKILETIGLAVPRQGGGHYDRFRGRVLFPIHDAQGRSIGIGGRVLPGDGNPAKYLNSSESPLFAKSSVLYGLDLAKAAIASAKSVLVTEGYTDTIIAHQTGHMNCVAVLGTALGEKHIPVLRRHADRVVLVLDGDEAGRRRADQILELFIAEAVDLRILTLPDELDPCDFLLTRGASEFARLVETADDALEHKFRQVTSEADASRGSQGALVALESILGTLARAPRLRPNMGGVAQLKEDQVLQRIAHRCGVSEERVRARLVELRRVRNRAPAKQVEAHSEPVPPRIDFDAIDAWDRELVELLLRHPASASEMRVEVPLDDIASEPCRRIVAQAWALADAHREPTLENLLIEFDEPEIKSLLVRLDESGAAKPGEPAKRWQMWLARHRERVEDRAQTSVTRDLREGAADDKQRGKELLAELVESRRTRHGISASTDG